MGMTDMRGIRNKVWMTMIHIMGGKQWLVNHRRRLMEHYRRWIVDDWGTVNNH